jgi:hypothetical protein
VILTVADNFYFVGKPMVLCLVLIALMRRIPLALPPIKKA